MKKSFLICLIVLLGIMIQTQIIETREYAVLTVVVQDIYANPVDYARVSITRVYPRPEDSTVPDQFTKNGAASFNLEAYREYILTVTKAGFLAYTKEVELEEDTTITVTLEHAQKLPVLHVLQYTLTPGEVSPGEHFELHLTIENKGTGDALSVRIAAAPAQIFSPVQPSSSAYFERLDVRKVTSFSLTFAVSGEALSGVYNLLLTIKYQDAASIPYTIQESVGIPILRRPLVKLLNADYPKEVEEGESFTFSVEIANGGRFAVNGLYLEVVSDMDWEYSSYYIGSLEAGDYDTFESEVMAHALGDHIFIIRVGFVDDFNRVHSQEKSFSISVKEKLEETPPPQEKGLWQKFIEWLKAFLGLG